MASPRSGLIRFGLSNFKAFHYLDDIELRPLTILVGPNNCGKSSILQSIALLSQTLASGPFDLPLLFDGNLVRLQSFETIVSAFDTGKPVEYRFFTEDMIPTALAETAFQLQDLKTTEEELRQQTEIRLSFALEGDRVVPSIMVKSWLPDYASDNAVLNFDSKDIIGLRSITQQAGKRLLNNSLGLAFASIKLLGVNRDRLFKRTDNEMSDEINNSEFDISGVKFEKFLPSDVVFNLTSGKKKAQDIDIPINLFPGVGQPINFIKNILTSTVEYLGPVRADPKPFYPIDENPVLGTRGEGAIPFLLRHQQDQIEYRPSVIETPRTGSFLDALNHWLGKLGVTTNLTIDLVPKFAYTARVPSISAPEHAVNLSQVGFGISQLLPVLMMGLKDSKNSLLLYEQPEIHLHPRMQADLGDFFLSVAMHGKTIILETHSDYLVNRLRRRIAEDRTGELSKLVNILFVHPGTPERPGSYVEPLEIGSDGTIVNCPRDFFSESTDEAYAILRARSSKAH